MKHIIFLIALVGFFQLFYTPSSAKEGVQQLFDQANSEYVHKNYSVAVHDYHVLLRDYGASPALLFNLGQAYAELGQPGKAILFFKRAENLAPDDADIAAELKRVKKSSGIFTDPPGRVAKLANLLSPSQWSQLALATLILFSFLQMSLLFFTVKKKSLSTLSICCLLTTILSFGVLLYRWPNLSPSIVIIDDARLLLSPINGSDLVRTIKEGEEVYPLKKHSNYVYVRDSSGMQGWLVDTAMEAVINPNIFH